MELNKIVFGDSWEESETNWRLCVYNDSTKRPIMIVCGDTEKEVKQRTAELILTLESYRVAKQMIKDAEQYRDDEPPPGVKEVRIVQSPPVKSVVQEAIAKAIQSAKERIDSDVDKIS